MCVFVIHFAHNENIHTYKKSKCVICGLAVVKSTLTLMHVACHQDKPQKQHQCAFSRTRKRPIFVSTMSSSCFRSVSRLTATLS